MNAEARQWVDFLKTDPKKYKGKLLNPDNPEEKCCIGHGCHLFDIDTGMMGENTNSYLLFQKKVGLLEDCGGTLEIEKNGDLEPLPLKYKGKKIKSINTGSVISSLVGLNDLTDFKHKQIAEVIEENKDILFKE